MEDVNRVEWDLRERVKELTCLYGIAQVVDRPDLSLGEILVRIANLLPAAWQHAEIASARIVLDGIAYGANGFDTGCARQEAEVQVLGRARGAVEVCYRAERPPADEGPFLEEERTLLQEVARQVGMVVQRWEAERDRAQLEENLRKSDRLATIGQLAAGVAHELNEPLAAILGYAEIIREAAALPENVRRDLDRIIRSSLQAREIVRKLLVFASSPPVAKGSVRLDAAASNALGLLGSRCTRAGVKPVMRVAPDLPSIPGDAGQIEQVIVNLASNAIQAMPAGGTLHVGLERSGDSVVLSVEDTGVGMTEEVQSRLFTPFFTTKEVGAGTGLGLSVVHGIVAAHGGTVHVSSAPGVGTTVTVTLPAEATKPSESARP